MDNQLYINLHTHKLSNNENEFSIVSLFANEHRKISRNPNKKFSIGIHPWYINESLIKYEIDLIKTVAEKPEILAIGECGLDVAKVVPIDFQLEVFSNLQEIAASANKPLIIHCVRAYNELIAAKKKFKTTQSWIVHGFNTNYQTANQLIKNDFYISFGAALSKESVASIFKQMPIEKIFLETDDSDHSIESIYNIAAEIKNISLDLLKIQLIKNFDCCFKNVSLSQK